MRERHRGGEGMSDGAERLLWIALPGRSGGHGQMRHVGR